MDRWTIGWQRCLQSGRAAQARLSAPGRRRSVRIQAGGPRESWPETAVTAGLFALLARFCDTLTYAIGFCAVWLIARRGSRKPHSEQRRILASRRYPHRAHRPCFRRQIAIRLVDEMIIAATANPAIPGGTRRFAQRTRIPVSGCASTWYAGSSHGQMRSASSSTRQGHPYRLTSI